MKRASLQKSALRGREVAAYRGVSTATQNAILSASYKGKSAWDAGWGPGLGIVSYPIS
jgi:hypothetical protein